MQPKPITTLTDEEIVRAFLEEFSDDPFKTSEAEAAFNRLMEKYVLWKNQ